MVTQAEIDLASEYVDLLEQIKDLTQWIGINQEAMESLKEYLENLQEAVELSKQIP